VSAGPPLVLALDIGTGSVRAHLLDTEGHHLASAWRPVPVALGADARAELDTDQVWAAARAVLGEVLAQASPGRLAALAEGTATGLLLLAGLAVGLWTDLGEAARRIAPTERTIEPDPGRHTAYTRLSGLRRQTYAGLGDVFPELAEVRSWAAEEPRSSGAEEQQNPEPPQGTPAPQHHGSSAPLPPGSSAPPLPGTPAARPSRAGNVYLCGMIGSGKTAIGERLAAHMGRPFVDLDREMDRELGRSFHELVREQGWLAFRELEYRLCRRFARLEGAIVALGGGTVRYDWNVDVLRGTGIMVLLEAELTVLAQRVRTADRPRVNPDTSLEDDLRRIWSTACHLYRGAADLVYRTDAGKNLEEEVEELLAELIARGIH
jgi:shikimate kinase